MSGTDKVLIDFEALPKMRKLITLTQAARWQERAEVEHANWKLSDKLFGEKGVIKAVDPVHDFLIVTACLHSTKELVYYAVVNGVSAFPEPCKTFDDALIWAVSSKRSFGV